MPTLTFYVTDEVAEQFEKVIKKRTELSGITVSRGDILSPYIKSLYKHDFPKKGNVKAAHLVGKDEPVVIQAMQPGTVMSTAEVKA